MLKLRLELRSTREYSFSLPCRIKYNLDTIRYQIVVVTQIGTQICKRDTLLSLPCKIILKL